ncbi:unnamed protein product, partial [Polarella glacialis]
SLLQHSIGGNGFMVMLACLSPADKYYEENLSTLQYATQAALIKNKPVVNLDPKDRLIQQLRQQLEAAHAYILNNMGLEELPEELLQAASSRGERRRRDRSSSAAAGLKASAPEPSSGRHSHSQRRLVGSAQRSGTSSPEPGLRSRERGTTSSSNKGSKVGGGGY